MTPKTQRANDEMDWYLKAGNVGLLPATRTSPLNISSTDPSGTATIGVDTSKIVGGLGTFFERELSDRVTGKDYIVRIRGTPFVELLNIKIIPGRSAMSQHFKLEIQSIGTAESLNSGG
jgi:hypothetical protein